MRIASKFRDIWIAEDLRGFKEKMIKDREGFLWDAIQDLYKQIDHLVEYTEMIASHVGFEVGLGDEDEKK